ncbi:MAG: hypothetical protein Tsb005_03980 [Gammaproteobacteria bacterium]
MAQLKFYNYKLSKNIMGKFSKSHGYLDSNNQIYEDRASQEIHPSPSYFISESQSALITFQETIKQYSIEEKLSVDILWKAYDDFLQAGGDEPDLFLRNPTDDHKNIFHYLAKIPVDTIENARTKFEDLLNNLCKKAYKYKAESQIFSPDKMHLSSIEYAFFKKNKLYAEILLQQWVQFYANTGDETILNQLMINAEVLAKRIETLYKPEGNGKARLYDQQEANAISKDYYFFCRELNSNTAKFLLEMCFSPNKFLGQKRKEAIIRYIIKNIEVGYIKEDLRYDYYKKGKKLNSDPVLFSIIKVLKKSELDPLTYIKYFNREKLLALLNQKNSYGDNVILILAYHCNEYQLKLFEYLLTQVDAQALNTVSASSENILHRLFANRHNSIDLFERLINYLSVEKIYNLLQQPNKNNLTPIAYAFENMLKNFTNASYKSNTFRKNSDSANQFFDLCIRLVSIFENNQLGISQLQLDKNGNNLLLLITQNFEQLTPYTKTDSFQKLIGVLISKQAHLFKNLEGKTASDYTCYTELENLTKNIDAPQTYYVAKNEYEKQIEENKYLSSKIEHYKKLYMDNQEKNTSLQQKFESTKKENEQLLSSKKNLEENVSQLKEKLFDTQNLLKKEQANSQNLNRQLQDQKAELDKKNELIQQLEEIRLNSNKLKEQNESLQQNNKNLETNANNLTKEISKLNNLLETEKEKNETLNQQLEIQRTILNENDKLKKQSQEAENKYKQLREKNINQIKCNDILTKKIEELKNEKNETIKQIEIKNAKLHAKYYETIKELKNEITNLNNAHVNGLMDRPQNYNEPTMTGLSFGEVYFDPNLNSAQHFPPENNSLPLESRKNIIVESNKTELTVSQLGFFANTYKNTNSTKKPEKRSIEETKENEQNHPNKSPKLDVTDTGAVNTKKKVNRQLCVEHSEKHPPQYIEANSASVNKIPCDQNVNNSNDKVKIITMTDSEISQAVPIDKFDTDSAAISPMEISPQLAKPIKSPKFTIKQLKKSSNLESSPKIYAQFHQKVDPDKLEEMQYLTLFNDIKENTCTAEEFFTYSPETQLNENQPRKLLTLSDIAMSKEGFYGEHLLFYTLYWHYVSKYHCETIDELNNAENKQDEFKIIGEKICGKETLSIELSLTWYNRPAFYINQKKGWDKPIFYSSANHDLYVNKIFKNKNNETIKEKIYYIEVKTTRGEYQADPHKRVQAKFSANECALMQSVAKETAAREQQQKPVVTIKKYNIYRLYNAESELKEQKIMKIKDMDKMFNSNLPLGDINIKL